MRTLSLTKNIIDFISTQRASKSQLRSFAWVMDTFAIFLAIASWHFKLFLGMQIFSVLSLIFIVFGIFVPILLQPVFVIWMLFARILAFINTHLVLAFIFYTLFTVIGLILRLYRKDPLDRELKNDLVSYWYRPEHKELPRDHYERQF